MLTGNLWSISIEVSVTFFASFIKLDSFWLIRYPWTKNFCSYLSSLPLFIWWISCLICYRRNLRSHRWHLIIINTGHWIHRSLYIILIFNHNHLHRVLNHSSFIWTFLYINLNIFMLFIIFNSNCSWSCRYPSTRWFQIY